MARWLTGVFAVMALAVFAPANAAEVALTFDDLPVHGIPTPGASRADIARAIVAALQAAHAPPVYGFVNARGLVQ